jgi:PBP1b-binding outer membrane lipoprotein LpoB
MRMQRHVRTMNHLCVCSALLGALVLVGCSRKVGPSADPARESDEQVLTTTVPDTTTHKLAGLFRRILQDLQAADQTCIATPMTIL